MIRAGVIGLGFGENHVKTIASMEGVRLTAVADTVEERVNRISHEFGAKGFFDGVKLIHSGDIDAVIIAVSPGFRESLLKASSEKMVPVFIEKPWAADSKTGEMFSKIIDQPGLVVMAGFSFRLHPVARKLKELMGEELGKPLAVSANYVFDFLPPAERWLWDPHNGGGLFNENSCHLIDVVCDILGNAKTVSAAGGTYFGRPSEEAAAVSIQFEEGKTASLLIGGVGAGAFHDYPRLTVYTEKGQAVMKGHDHVWSELEWAVRGEKETKRIKTDPELLNRTRYTDGLEHFFTCIAESKQPAATADDGMRSVKISEAIYRSIREQTIVEVE